MPTGVWERKPAIERFWARVQKTDTCWIWTGAKTSGYGSFVVNKRDYRASRFSYEIHKGEIAVGYEIDHLCKNPPCVNPDHLEAVTPRENKIRSNNFAGVNFRKTQCSKGHPYNDENSRFYHPKNDNSLTYKRCKICERENKRILKTMSYILIDRKFRGFTQTHCKLGHEFTVENTIILIDANDQRKKSRKCKICDSLRYKRWYQKSKDLKEAV